MLRREGAGQASILGVAPRAGLTWVKARCDARRWARLRWIKGNAGVPRQTVRMAPHMAGARRCVMYQRILVPVDGSRCARRGLSEAIALARLTGARIRLVHVVDEPLVAIGTDIAAGAAADLVAIAREAAQRVLADATETVKLAGVPVDDLLLDSFDGRLCDLVTQAASSWAADLVVIGTHGRRGVGRLLLGSDAEQILRLSPVPVLLVRHD